MLSDRSKNGEVTQPRYGAETRSKMLDRKMRVALAVSLQDIHHYCAELIGGRDLRGNESAFYGQTKKNPTKRAEMIASVNKSIAEVRAIVIATFPEMRVLTMHEAGAFALSPIKAPAKSKARVERDAYYILSELASISAAHKIDTYRGLVTDCACGADAHECAYTDASCIACGEIAKAKHKAAHEKQEKAIVDVIARIIAARAEQGHDHTMYNTIDQYGCTPWFGLTDAERDMMKDDLKTRFYTARVGGAVNDHFRNLPAPVEKLVRSTRTGELVTPAVEQQQCDEDAADFAASRKGKQCRACVRGLKCYYDTPCDRSNLAVYCADCGDQGCVRCAPEPERKGCAALTYTRSVSPINTRRIAEASDGNTSQKPFRLTDAERAELRASCADVPAYAENNASAGDGAL